MACWRSGVRQYWGRRQSRSCRDLPVKMSGREVLMQPAAHLIMARMSALLGYVCTVSCATWNGVNTRLHAVSMNYAGTTLVSDCAA